MSMAYTISKILMMIILTGTYIEFHETAHRDICDYAGGNSFRKNFLTTVCIEAEDNPFAREAYILDCINELIASLFFPIFFFVMIKWIVRD